ncbi:MAG: preprotein translocase subunit YajC [Christensenellaceae bacterium]|jgi:preprotein translocase subunit YajC
MPTSCLGSTASTAAGAADGASAGGGWTMWIFPILLIVVMVVMIIVPNKRREKKFKEMVDAIKVGDAVKTIGGFYGKVISIKEDLVTFECGPEKTPLVISKSAIASVESYDDGAEVSAK